MGAAGNKKPKGMKKKHRANYLTEESMPIFEGKNGKNQKKSNFAGKMYY